MKSANVPAALGGPKAVTLSPKRKWPFVDQRAINEVIKVLETGKIFDFGRGPEITALEDELAEYHSSKFVLATNSGTSALKSIYFAIGIGQGDEVIAPTYTFHATISPLLNMGAKIILVDCEKETGNIDVRQIERVITPRTKAIVVTHFWGHPVDMDPLMELSERYNLPIIEDAAQAMGASYKGRKVGTFGIAAAFSLGGAKMVTGGTGGAVLTADKQIYDKALLLGHSHERSMSAVEGRMLEAAEIGFGENYRINPIAAVICQNQIQSLDERIKVKSQNFTEISRLLERYNLLRPPREKEGCTRGSWYGYKAFHDSERQRYLTTEQLIKALKMEGVRITKPNTAPLHQSGIFSGKNSRPTGSPDHVAIQPKSICPVADQLYSEVVGFADQDFHNPEEELIRQYSIAFEKVAENEKRIAEKLSAE